MRTFFLGLVIHLVLASAIIAKSGPEIPEPEISLADAIKSADVALSRHLEKSISKGELASYLKKVIMSGAEYSQKYVIIREPIKVRELGRWGWIITYVHRVHNDHSWIFFVRRNEVILIDTNI